MNIIDIFYENVKKAPNKIAIICEDKKLSYKKLSEDIEKLSITFREKGLKENDKIVILLNNSIEFATTLLTCAKEGLTLVAVNPSLKIGDIKKTIKSTDAKAILSYTHILKNIKNELIDIKYIDIVNDFQNISLKDIKQNFKKSNISVDIPYILSMTSGSTGDPKPIIFSQKTKIDRAFLSAKKLYNLNKNDTILASTPMYHSLAQRLVLLPLLMGATSVISVKFSPKKWLEAIQKHRVTFTMTTSTHINLILKEMEKNCYDLSSLKTIVSSSALLPYDIKQRCIKEFKASFYEIYGASEVGTLTNLSPIDTHKSKSVGKALDYVDIKIILTDSTLAKPNQIGEIVCYTKTAFLGYYNLPQKTKKSFWKEKYFKTGDLGYLDEDGYLYFSGRKKEMINVSGINVYPKDIEEVINSCSLVKECAVIGVDDQYFGEAILAIISDENANLKEIKRKCLDNLADFQQPHAFEVIKELPKNEMGKISKLKLKEIYKNYDATKNFRKLKGFT